VQAVINRLTKFAREHDTRLSILNDLVLLYVYFSVVPTLVVSVYIAKSTRICSPQDGHQL